ncbi:hypothetical protein O59_001181 [Cellvibrio sp. BR]|nr:hypothetical protein O59_001181 [Cellvibrio sp. BR]QEY14087.1 hypothetical protein D0B88_18560 [Cellvibrio sp. KY-YJ-3]
MYISIIKKPARVWILRRLLLYAIFFTTDNLLFLKALILWADKQEGDMRHEQIIRIGAAN